MVTRATKTATDTPTTQPLQSPTKRPAKQAAKPAAKSPAKTAAPTPAVAKPQASKADAPRQAAKPTALPAKPVPRAKPVEKARKPKMVRDSFTMPKAEYAAIESLKARATQAGRPAKKSELLRAGVKLLEALPAAALIHALESLPAINTGRPAKD